MPLRPIISSPGSLSLFRTGRFWIRYLSHPHSSMLKSAPWLFWSVGQQVQVPYSSVDCAAATKYSLAAKALDWVQCGWVFTQGKLDGGCELFKIPEGETPFSLIAVGYPVRKNPAWSLWWAEDHYNRWWLIFTNTTQCSQALMMSFFGVVTGILFFLPAMIPLPPGEKYPPRQQVLHKLYWCPGNVGDTA